MAPLRGAIGSDKELEHVKTTYSIKRNAINQIKQALRRSLSDPLNVKINMNQFSISIDLEDDTAGLSGRFEANGFKGFGEGWFNTSDIIRFCNNLKKVATSLEGEAEIVAGQYKSDGSEYLELFGVRCYVISKTGILGVHVHLTDHPYTDCRPQEISSVSGELKIECESALKFANDLHNLCLDRMSEVKLVGRA
ncbi:MAG: hypothetical protein IBX64_13255 [Actinobacteria bacterium]|nr:hypothetical protein [Actinomycetota bacterium]